MKKSAKLLSILMLIVMLSTVTMPVFAQISPNDISATYDNNATSDLTTIAGKILGLIRNFAVIAGVILIAVMGVKFMLGSAEEKAEYKKSFVPLIVGIIVVMAATQIATMIFGFFD